MSADGGKLVDLDAAVAGVRSGAHVAVGGMMLYRRPVALCRALAQAGVDGLTVTTMAAGFETELLVQAGCVATLRTCYAGLEYFGPAPRIKAAAEAGELEFVDETEMSLASGLLARTLDVPWLPSAHALVDTDYPRVRADIVEWHDEASDRHLLRLPAIAPDVVLLHAPFADEHGNVIFHASPALDRELAFGGTVIVSADSIVSTEELRAQGEIDLLSFQVDAVVEAPGGARPTSSRPHYGYDAGEILDYLEAG